MNPTVAPGEPARQPDPPAREGAPRGDSARRGRRRCDPDGKITSWHWLGLGATIAAFVLLLWLLPTRDWVAGLIDGVTGLGGWGVAVYAVAYAILAVLAVPVTPLNIGAGVLFGWWVGFLAAMAGSTAAAVGSFLIARYVAQDWVRGKLACYPKYAALVRDVERDEDRAWKVVLLVRLNPLVPASIKNYCFGITKVSLATYTLAAVAAQLPVAVIYTYLGSAGYLTLREGGGPLGPADYVLYGVGLVAAVVVTALMTWYGKRKLDEIDRRPPDPGATEPAEQT